MKELIADIIKLLNLDPAAKPQIVNAIYNMLALFLWLFMGSIGMLSYRFSNGNRPSTIEILTCMGFGLFAGTMTYIICMWQSVNPLLGGVLTSTFTMCGKELCLAVIQLDYKGTFKEKFAQLLEHWADKLKKNDKP